MKTRILFLAGLTAMVALSALALDQEIVPGCKKVCHAHICDCGGNYHKQMPKGRENPNNPEYPNAACNVNCTKAECCLCKKESASRIPRYYPTWPTYREFEPTE